MTRHVLLCCFITALVLATGCSSSTDPGDDNGNGGGGGGGGGGDLDQAGAWMWVNPSPTGDNVWRLQFASDSVVYGVTAGGAVLKSTDSGRSWELAYKVYEATDMAHSSLHGLHFLSEDEGWVVGTNGQVSYTDDGGVSWSSRSVVTTSTLRDVHYFDSMNGIVAGDRGALHRTGDGGASWSPVTHPAGLEDLTAVVFTDATTGWVGGENNTLLHSTDGGATWTPTDLQGTWNVRIGHEMENGGACFVIDRGLIIANSPTDFDFTLGVDTALDAHFIDEDNGKALYLDDGEYFLGTRSNRVWTHQQLKLPQSGLSYAERGSNAVIGSWWGLTSHSTNNGFDWSDSFEMLDNADRFSSQLMDVAFDGDLGITAGSNGTILRSRDAGLSWDARPSGSDEWLRGAWVEGTMAFAVGENSTLLRSADSGNTWNPATTNGDVQTFHGLCMWDDMNGIVVGKQLLKTADGGLTWIVQSVPLPGATPAYFAASVVGTTHAWVGARDGHVARTVDGGASWTLHDTGAFRAIQSIYFINETHGWAGTNSQEFVYTTDGGTNWTNTQLPGSFDDVQFGSELVGIGVGSTGTVFGSVDGGVTWEQQHSGLTTWSHVKAVWMSSPTDAVIVGTESKILYTRTAGLLP